MLSSHGEEAPKRWTKIELLQMVEEVTGVDYTRTTAQEKSEYRMYMSALNQAATRKNTLQAYCRKTLDMEVNPNLTIAQLQKEAVSVIYGKATPDPSDLVGFGRHSQLTYATLKAEHEQYCAWAIQTAREGQWNPRLRRLAGWLANDAVLVKRAQEEFLSMSKLVEKAAVGYPVEPTTPRGASSSTPPTTRSQTKKSPVKNPEESEEETVQVGTEVLANLVQTIEMLKCEVATLKGERPRKKQSSEDSDASFSLAGSL